jgi:hypothetical protein
MRLFWAMLGALLVAQCASDDDKRFRAGESPRAFVIIGVAESGANTAPNYTMLWRRVDADGAFSRYDDNNIFQPRTHTRNSVRIRGIPGEFAMAEVDPGVYALDSVFALIRDERVNYSANGVVIGPERPTFEVRPGEAIYLGIWELNLEDVTAVARPWRVDPADMRAVLREADATRGEVRVRETYTSAVPCAPHRVSNNSQRQVC